MINMTHQPKETFRNVLLVEDDPTVVSAVAEQSAARQMRFHHAPTLDHARSAITNGPRFDAIVLDLGLPDGDGMEFARQYRKSDSQTPIIMVTARGGVGDRIAGLQSGADDYLCKPFVVEELMARLEALFRRSVTRNDHVLRYRDVELDLVKRCVRRQDREVTLSAREVDLLAYFMCHSEEVLPKDRILREVWGDEAVHDSNVLHVYANYLRNKLEGGVYPRILHTVRGEGYILS